VSGPTNLPYPEITSSAYRPDIDGLRAVAVLGVVIFHGFPKLIPGGFVGVDVFFVISGYLISSILIDQLQKDRFSVIQFYKRRIRRIFPALILVLTVCLAAGWFIFFAGEYRQLGNHVAAGVGFVSNFLLLSEVNYFDAAAVTKPLLHLWSLGVEEQFYIVWPFMLWAAWRCRLNIFVAIVVLLIISFSLALLDHSRDGATAFYSPQTRFWELLTGALLACIAVRSPSLSSCGHGHQTPFPRSEYSL
jgi:peptidoglycan/LPS O-acetylase OafA/YrhL